MRAKVVRRWHEGRTSWSLKFEQLRKSMPCTIKIRVVEARDLPVMDRASKLADAYVGITFASFEAKSSVSRKTLNPKWDEEFRFDVADDSVLQSQPIEFKLMDHDVYTSDSTIGIVYVDLNSLLMREGHVIQGWFPIYDTLLGVRCELSLVIRLHYFGDVNPFRESSAGVQFFGLSTLDPNLYSIDKMLGFVEELVVHADPEYSWSDNFRTSRKSNEYRQLLLYKLSSQVVTLVGKKALELGGNAVLAYKQFFDVEGDSGMVARACGTACYITPVERTNSEVALDVAAGGSANAATPSLNDNDDAATSGGNVEPALMGTSSFRHLPIAEKEDALSISTDTPLVDNGPSSPQQRSFFPSRRLLKTLKAPEGFDISVHDEVQLITLKVFYPFTRIRLGGIVSARSVKYLGKLATKLADQETRDSWWMEIREEIRAHAQSLQCPFVIGYCESCSIHDDVCVLSATGTAAVLKNPTRDRLRRENETSNVVREEINNATNYPSPTLSDGGTVVRRSPPTTPSYLPVEVPVRARPRVGRRSRLGYTSPCQLCHIPYSRSLAPFSNMRMVRCGLCGNKWVPEMLITSIEPPSGLAIMGRGRFIQARVCRQRRKGTGDVNATIVSDALPFLEYELYRQLSVKMKVLGVNALFGYESQIQVGGSLIVGIITGTGLFLPALPPPPALHIERNIEVKDEEDRRLVQLQELIESRSTYNKGMLYRDRISIVQPEFEYMVNRILRSQNSSAVMATTSNLSSEDTPSVSTLATTTTKKSFKNTPRRAIKAKRFQQLGSLSITTTATNEATAPVTTPEFEVLTPTIQQSDEGKLASSSSESSSDSEEESYLDGFSDSKQTFVLEIDDETDEDLMSVLLEQELPEGISMCSTDRLPGDFTAGSNIQLIVSMKRVEWDEDRMRDTRLNELLSIVFKDLLTTLLFKIRSFAPCAICGLKTRVSVASETMVEVVLLGMAVLERHDDSDDLVPVEEDTHEMTSQDLETESTGNDKEIDSVRHLSIQAPTLAPCFPHGRSLTSKSILTPNVASTVPLGASAAQGREWIEITPLSFIPSARIVRYLGRVTLHFIKESWTVRESGGLGAFYHLFLHEAIAIVRAHVRALGGNALLTFRLVPIESSQLYRNQVYNMISITGDAVMVEREDEVPCSIVPALWALKSTNGAVYEVEEENAFDRALAQAAAAVDVESSGSTT